MVYSDLYVFTNDENWTITTETQKYASAARSFCSVTTEERDQQDMCKLITMPQVQRSLYVNEVTDDFGNIKAAGSEGVDSLTRDMLERCMTTCGKAAGARAQMGSRAREASAQEV